MLRIPSHLLRDNEKCFVNLLHCKRFKNFGHKKQPVPRFTVLWHGFLTFSFIGFGLEWKRIGRFIFGDDVEKPSPLE